MKKKLIEEILSTWRKPRLIANFISYKSHIDLPDFDPRPVSMKYINVLNITYLNIIINSFMCTVINCLSSVYPPTNALNKIKYSWIKLDQLMSLALFLAQHVSNASTFIFRILRLCVGILLVRCVLALRCGSAGVMWYPYAGWGTSASHQPSRTTP